MSDRLMVLRNGLQVAVTAPSPIPVGSVISYAGSAAPTDWMLCHGQAISRSTYAALFAAVSTTYGAGNGSTTFNLPDLRGRVVAGKDDMGGSAANRITNAASGITGTTLGASGGVQEHLLTHGESGVPAHSHDYVDTLRNSVTRANGAVSSAGGTEIPSGKTTSPNTATDAAEAHINMQPTMILNHIIRVSP